MKPAPIALFCYCRPHHLRRVLDALKSNFEAELSTLYVFSDGPKDTGSVEGVTDVRQALLDIKGFGRTHVILRDENYGLARNITEGVTEVLRHNETIIVLEDDICAAPFFLKFMNQALHYYRSESRVGSISGYSYPISEGTGPETYFIRGADCWGWATWRDRWQSFDMDGISLLQQLGAQGLTGEFDLGGAMGFTRMLEDQIAGQNDSWAIRWHATCFLRNLLVLYPREALAQNIGHDGSGTHCTLEGNFFEAILSREPVRVGGIPIEESPWARQRLTEFFLKQAPSADHDRPLQP